MSATFTALFDRSRYSSQGRWLGLDEVARKQRMEQQERFAVGMIGFTLEHDAEFKTHFLDGICGLKDLSRTTGWEVLVEPENWGDLVLKHRASDSLIVAEFKIGAELAAHQDPSKSLFDSPATDGQCAGYGWEIEQIAAREKWRQLRYVTVEKKASWSKVRKEDQNLECVHAEWKQFLREDVAKESKLEADVYDCLADFGIQTFIARRIKHMKEKLAKTATKPLAILSGVLDHFEVEFRSMLFRDISHEWLGVYIEKKDFPALAKIVDQPGKCIGWFGYHSGKPDGPRLCVELHPSSNRRKLSILKRLKRNLPNARVREFGDLDMEVFCRPDESPGDMEWFIKVVAVLNK